MLDYSAESCQNGGTNPPACDQNTTTTPASTYNYECTVAAMDITTNCTTCLNHGNPNNNCVGATVVGQSL